MAGWPKSDLQDLLGIEHPIIQAPMASAATPALAAAVSNAGGLGSLGSATLSPEQVREQADAFRSESNRIFNANFFVHDAPVADGAAEAAMRERLAPYYEEMALGDAPAARDIFPIFNEEMLAAVLDLRPGVVSFHFGLPPREMIGTLKEAGAIILASATTVREAVALEKGGVDAVIAQGFEAGGRVGARDRDLAHVGDVEEAGGLSGMPVLGHDSGGKLHRHLVAGERHHPGAERHVETVEGCLFRGLLVRVWHFGSFDRWTDAPRGRHCPRSSAPSVAGPERFTGACPRSRAKTGLPLR